MTDCPNGDIRDLLPDLLHDRLDAGARARVEQHVATCDACGEELALLRDLRATLRRAPVLDTAAIAAAIPAYRAPVQRSWGGSWRAAAAIAAIAIGGTSIALVTREGAVTTVPKRVAIVPVHDSLLVAQVDSPSSRAPSVTPAPRVDDSARTAPAPSQTTVASEPSALALSSGALGELSDRDLATLLDELDSLDALPSEDVEGAGSLAGSVSLESSR
jgi:anti-sigma factor RsiW